MSDCPHCPKGEDPKALISVRERAKAFCTNKNVTSAAIVRMEANGAFTVLHKDDERIGDKFKLVEYFMP